MNSGATKTPHLDVRQIYAPQRHPLILGRFDDLAPGEALLLLDDHDPKPLFYPFQAQARGEFTWDYLESGPDTWRIRIGKCAPGAVAVARCCTH